MPRLSFAQPPVTTPLSVAQELIGEEETLKKTGTVRRQSHESWERLDEAGRARAVEYLIEAGRKDALDGKAGIGEFALTALSELRYGKRTEPLRGKFSASLTGALSEAKGKRIVRWTRIAVDFAGDEKELRGYVDGYFALPEKAREYGDASSVVSAIASRDDGAAARVLMHRLALEKSVELARDIGRLAARQPTLMKHVTEAEVMAALARFERSDVKITPYLNLAAKLPDGSATPKVVAFCWDLTSKAPLKDSHDYWNNVEACFEALADRKAADPRFLPIAKKILDDSPVGVHRRTLLVNIGAAVGAKAAPLLLSVLRAAHREEAIAAAKGLADTGHRDPALLGRLRELFDDPDTKSSSSDKEQLIDVLPPLVGPAARDLLLRELTAAKTIEELPENLIRNLASLGPFPKAADTYFAMLDAAKDNYRRGRLAEQLPSLYGKEGFERIAELLSRKKADDRWLRDGLLEGLSKMPEVDEGILAKHLPTLDKTWRPGLADLLTLYEARRKEVPAAERPRWDRWAQGLLEKRFAAEAPDADAVCARVCELARDAGKWLSRSGDYSGFLSGLYLEGGWTYAMQNLFGAFVSHAAPYCPKDRLSTEQALATWRARRGWYPRLWSYLKSRYEAMQWDHLTPSFDKSTVYEKALRDELDKVKAGISAADYERALEFLKKTKSGVTVPDTLANPAGLYGKAFQVLWYKQLLKTERLAPGERAVLEADVRALQKTIGDDLSRHEKYQMSRWGSGVNTFAYSLATLALDDGQVAVGPLAELMSSLKDPLGVPYDVAATRSDGQFPTARGAAARAPLLYGAIALHGRDVRIVDRAKALTRRSLGNFHAHALELALHLGRDNTHEGEDGLAPYYFLPSVAYYTGLLTAEADKKAADGETKERRRFITGLLMRLSEGAGKHLAMGAATYPDSRTFGVPLAGLALLPLIDRCDGRAVPRSYGLLEARLAPGAPGAPPAPGKSADSH